MVQYAAQLVGFSISMKILKRLRHELQTHRKQASRQGVLLTASFFCAMMTAVASTTERVEFTRMVAHWAGYADPGYLPFIDDAKPEIAQVGFYGAHFWSLADTTSYGGYPANLPVRGHRE
ncbi:MAG TPA: hypothetical protein VFQ43_13915, partial [Nitrososphaera sp.]|nr:hypothetical protein [Nitrososphaera sp.]